MELRRRTKGKAHAFTHQNIDNWSSYHSHQLYKCLWFDVYIDFILMTWEDIWMNRIWPHLELKPYVSYYISVKPRREWLTLMFTCWELPRNLAKLKIIVNVHHTRIKSSQGNIHVEFSKILYAPRDVSVMDDALPNGMITEVLEMVLGWARICW